jgi:anti-sigma B factor antagonist
VRAVLYNPPIEAGQLEIREEVEGARHTLKVGGELDIASARELEAELRRACSSGAKEVVLDLSGVDFLDSTGFRALIACKEFCQARGCRLTLTRATEPVQRVVDLSGLRRKLPFS